MDVNSRGGLVLLQLGFPTNTSLFTFYFQVVFFISLNIFRKMDTMDYKGPVQPESRSGPAQLALAKDYKR